MKIALIGYGKMGKTIERIALERGHEIVSIIDIENIEDFDSAAFNFMSPFSMTLTLGDFSWMCLTMSALDTLGCRASSSSSLIASASFFAALGALALMYAAHCELGMVSILCAMIVLSSGENMFLILVSALTGLGIAFPKKDWLCAILTQY